MPKSRFGRADLGQVSKKRDSRKISAFSGRNAVGRISKYYVTARQHVRVPLLE